MKCFRVAVGCLSFLPGSNNLGSKVRRCLAFYAGHMMQYAGLPAADLVPNTLDIRRFYSAVETADRFAATVEDLDEWVREGCIEPVVLNGEALYSGLAIAKLLGWPLSDDPLDYLLGQDLGVAQ